MPALRHLEQVAALLVADDPRRAADKTLAFLIEHSGSRAGAVLGVGDEGVSVFVSRNVDVTRLGDMQSAWATHRATLGAGKPVVFEGRLLAPVFDGSQLVALLYLDTPKAVDEDTFAGFRVALAKAVTARSDAQSLESYLASTRTEDLQRDQLLIALDRAEWNIAQAARRLGVTRRTVYLRLQRFGIVRKRVRKSPRRREATA